jgi:hypothetical protein
MNKPSLFSLVLLLMASAAHAKDLSGLYDPGTLSYWETRYPVSTRKIFDQVILPVLTVEEKQRLSGVQLDFPIHAGSFMKGQPLAFYHPAGLARVVMPIFSLKFLDDLCTAYAWLQVKGYSLETISDYTAMLKYKDFPGGRYPPPLQALHIPDDALKDKEVNDLALGHFVTARTFILLHELGHYYYRHAATTTEQSRHNEEQADAFAAEVMGRTPLPPLGMLVFFLADAHWADYRVNFSSDEEWEQHLLENSTHPLSGERLHALAKRLEDPDLAREINALGDFLDDPDIQAGIILTAKSTSEAALAPRRPGQLANMRQSASSNVPNSLPFQGNYVGTSTQISDPGSSFPVVVVLNRQDGNQVKGQYTFGLGQGTIEGTVSGDSLFYDWNWAGNYGRGILRSEPNGTEFSGTWGYRESANNGGQWRIRRQD